MGNSSSGGRLAKVEPGFRMGKSSSSIELLIGIGPEILPRMDCWPALCRPGPELDLNKLTLIVGTAGAPVTTREDEDEVGKSVDGDGEGTEELRRARSYRCEVCRPTPVHGGMAVKRGATTQCYTEERRRQRGSREWPSQRSRGTLDARDPHGQVMGWVSGYQAHRRELVVTPSWVEERSGKKRGVDGSQWRAATEGQVDHDEGGRGRCQFMDNSRGRRRRSTWTLAAASRPLLASCDSGGPMQERGGEGKEGGSGGRVGWGYLLRGVKHDSQTHRRAP